MANEMELLISIGGGIFGGIIVNVFSIQYQKLQSRKEEKEDYKKDIKAKLNEIVDTWNKEKLKKRIDQERILKEFDIYSNQLTSIISRAPDDFPENIKKQIRELSTSLKKLHDFRISVGREKSELFKKKIQEIIDKVKEISI